MLSAFGWVVVRASRECYVNVTSLDQVDKLDRRIDEEDERLWRRLQDWLEAQENSLLKWQFFEHFNNDSGVLQVFTSTNHRSSILWELIEWIAQNGVGSYGLIYVHDDEDFRNVAQYGDGQHDYCNVFRVWRILGGKVDELDDPFLSPLVPRINPSEYA